MKKPLRGVAIIRACSLGAALFWTLVESSALAMGDETFVGPFPSWTNLKAAYHAKGDSQTDDTAAIQAALDALGPKAPVLYFPAGTYRITRPLHILSRIHVSIVGEDPTKTRILWDGERGANMLSLDGFAYSRLDRLTFDGGGKAGVAIDQSWRGSGGYFDTGNQYADDTFENAGTGFLCGNKGYGCAETSMLRDRFLNDGVAGIALKNFNALDMFVWDSRFAHDGMGATNQPGAGNFHIYDSIFEGSRSSDIAMGNTGLFNFRGNYSIGSKNFLIAGGTNNPAEIMIQDNTILDTENPTAISVGNFGPLLLLDNKIRSKAGSGAAPVVRAAGFGSTDLFSFGNTFTASQPLFASGRLHAFADRTTERVSLNPARPELPGTPPRENSDVFEVTPSASALQILDVVKAAVASRSPNPVVHLPAGTYQIDSTIEIPAGRVLQIVGDGYETRLLWRGKSAGPVLRLDGPSKAILREFSINGMGHQADGIVVENADQTGSRVFMESAFLTSSYVNLSVEGLDRTRVELRDFEHSGAQKPSQDGVSIAVSGGPLAASGHWAGGATDIFAGASNGNNISYTVSNGAHLAVEDIWYDAGGHGEKSIAQISGTSVFTYAGSPLYQSQCSNGPAIGFNNFHGIAALLDLAMSCTVEVASDSSHATIAAVGLLGSEKQFFWNRSPVSQSVFLEGQSTASPPPGKGSYDIAESGNPSQASLEIALRQVRTETPSLLASLPAGVTDVRFYRLFVEDAGVGVTLKEAETPKGTPSRPNHRGYAQ